MLEIKDLYASIDNKQVLRGINLKVEAGQVHAIMGPNGSGKSTLSNVITGKPGYTVDKGDILYKGQSILAWTPEERACQGIFMSFQYPVEIPGVPMVNFIKAAVNAKRRFNGQGDIAPGEFLKILKEKGALVELSPELTKRAVNVGFSGGEKKKNEIFQMAMLEPTLSILDETDSGLDIDALKIVAKGVNALKSVENSTLVITHYQRLLDYIIPDVIHILYKGKIVKSAGKELALELEKKGYDWLK
ncbi:MAG: Fe-S cluster assembly ATPase SufC [Bacteroidales bacterium]